MDREDIQSRRAANQAWNGAENYDIRPEFQAFDSNGDAQLYFNTVIGLVYRYYRFELFKPLFHAFQHQPKGDLYSDLFWLGLEGVTYHRAVQDRPVLEELRRQYAAQVLAEARAADPRDIVSLRAAWFRRSAPASRSFCSKPAWTAWKKRLSHTAHRPSPWPGWRLLPR